MGKAAGRDWVGPMFLVPDVRGIVQRTPRVVLADWAECREL